MSAFDTNIQTKFFGLNKQDVNKYLQNLINEQNKQLEELLKQKKRLEREIDKLSTDLLDAKKEVVKYEEEVIKKPEATSDELVNNAHTRLEKTTALINMLADEETEQLAKKANEDLSEYDEIIKNLQAEIDESKKKIESMLSGVLKLLKSNVDNISTKNDDLKEEKDYKENQILKNRKEIKDFREKINENKFFSEKKENDRITADGTSLSDISKLLMFRKKYASIEKDDEEALEEELPKKKSPRDEIYDIINGYDIDDDLNNSLFENKKIEETKYSSNEDYNSVDSDEPKNDSDIKKMRNALIIGKISGEDLLDSDNNIIIPKGKTLSEDDVALAEKASKLPELIINMVLPK